MAEHLTSRSEPSETGGLGKIEDPGLAAVKHLLTQLDKSLRTARTYGASNPVAQKFFQQFYSDLTAYLAIYDTLSLLVLRFELYHRGEVVYHNFSPTESLAFKLYADGIRELSLSRGLSPADLSYFLATVGGNPDSPASDEDIVTRLWEKNLSGISLVTAEEIIKSSELAEGLTPQDSETLNSPVSRLREITAAEAAHQAKEEAAGNKTKPQFQPDLARFEITPEELEQLGREREAESARESTAYVLDILTAMLASEQSADLLSRLLNLFAEILESLLQQGNWKLLNTIVSMLHETERLWDLSEDHKKGLADVFDALGRSERMQSIKMILNGTPHGPTDGLLAFLLQLKPTAVPALCGLLGDLEHQEHRSIVCEALATLAKDSPEPLIYGLNDPRRDYVLDLISIIERLNHPRAAESLRQLTRHSDSHVRKKVLRTLGLLCPAGDGGMLIAFLVDPEESVRRSALKLLITGNYTARFRVWSPVVARKEFLDRSTWEKQTTFLAMIQTAGEEAVPYWHRLVSQRLWPNHKRKQELGLLAVDALARIGSPAAMSALEAGQKRLNRVIRKACTAALATLEKPQGISPAGPRP